TGSQEAHAELQLLPFVHPVVDRPDGAELLRTHHETRAPAHRHDRLDSAAFAFPRAPVPLDGAPLSSEPSAPVCRMPGDRPHPVHGSPRLVGQTTNRTGVPLVPVSTAAHARCLA